MEGDDEFFLSFTGLFQDSSNPTVDRVGHGITPFSSLGYTKETRMSIKCFREYKNA